MKKRNIIIILLLTIIVLFFTLKDNFNEIITSLLNINIIWLIISYLLVLSYTFIKSIVTNNILNKLKKTEFKKTFVIQIITFFFNSVTPFSSGGQPFQVYMFNKTGVSLVDSTNTVVQETIIHQIALILVGVVSIILNKIFNVIEINSFLYTFLIIGFIANIVIVLILYLVSNNTKINKFVTIKVIKLISKFKNIDVEKTKEKFIDAIEKLRNNSKILLKDKKRFVSLIFLNAVALISLYLVPLTLLFSLNDYSSFNGITSIILTTFISIISSYIPLPGGTVGQEYMFTLLFESYIVNPKLGTLMLIWRFITYYLPLTVGALVFNIKQKEYIK